MPVKKKRSHEGRSITYLGYAGDWGNSYTKLVYASTDPIDFLEHVGKVAYAISQKLKNSMELSLVILWSDANKSMQVGHLGLFAPTLEGKLYPYIGQGIFGMKSIGVKTLERYALLAIQEAREEAENATEE